MKNIKGAKHRSFFDAVKSKCLPVAVVLSMLPGRAWAAGGGALDISDIHSVLAGLGSVICVVAVCMIGYNAVKFGQSVKDQQGFQVDNNLWGIVGGAIMLVAGGAFATAGNMWIY